jgi:hypothetical protein
MVLANFPLNGYFPGSFQTFINTRLVQLNLASVRAQIVGLTGVTHVLCRQNWRGERYGSPSLKAVAGYAMHTTRSRCAHVVE